MSLLEISNLHVEFGGLKAVNGLDLEVNAGEILCLLGPNGAGKSTTLDLICGKTKHTAGSIRFAGQDISGLPEYRRARAGIGRKFQVPSVFKDLRVDENIAIAVSKAYGLVETFSSFASGRSREVEDVLSLVGLVGKNDELAGNLSHGETQWLEIAMLVAQDSKLILMDEPTAGMTIRETDETAQIFRNLSRTHALIVVEHDMGFVRQVADRVTVMNRGEMLADGTIEEIEANPAVKSAYLGH